MRIAILGTRGIPNHYGGFEQCAEYLALGLAQKGHEVFVYNSHNHPYQQSEWNNVKLIHIHDPEYKLGTIGQFVYDYKCIRDVRSRNCDVILQLGYTSSSIWGWLLPKNVIVTTTMDGLEWKKTKYSKAVRKFLLYAEKLAVRFSDHLVCDSIGIQAYLRKRYGAVSTYIPYGAHIFKSPDPSILTEYQLEPYNYNLFIARLQPENSIETILDGVDIAQTDQPFLVIGNHLNKYGKFLKEKYKDNQNIRFISGIYHTEKLNNLRFYSNIYFHGHTLGGTSPSLLDAMGSGSLVCANSNSFSSHILGTDALYFSTAADVSKHLKSVAKAQPLFAKYIMNNIRKVKEIYTWERITERYEAHFLDSIQEQQNRPSKEQTSCASC